VLSKKFEISRQLVFYVCSGLLQLLVDWMLFLLLNHLGVRVAVANLLSRSSAAIVGYTVNGTLTFGNLNDPKLSRMRFIRYASLWIVTTCLSTLIVVLGKIFFGPSNIWIVKLAGEGLLVGLSFIFQKFWVYR
jgi:putative flippase GtrA